MGVSVGCRAKKLPYIASMGIYVLKASAIRKLLYEHFPEVSSKPELELGSRSTPRTSVMACACYVCNLLSTVVSVQMYQAQNKQLTHTLQGCITI
jgi:ADP-glucose pyrophosphorylase